MVLSGQSTLGQRQFEKLVGKARQTGSEEERKLFLANAKSRVWLSWLNSLEGGSVAPTLDDLICAVAVAGPFSIFKLPARSTTLHDWSLALIYAVFPEELPPLSLVPGWIVLVALQRLGFGSRLPIVLEGFEEIFKPRKIESHEADVIKGFTLIDGERSRIGALIINGQGADSDGWQPSSENAAVVVNDLQVQRFLELSTRIPVTEWVDWVVFDLTAVKKAAGTQSVQGGQSNPILSKLEESRSEVLLFLEQNEDDLETTDSPRFAVVLPEEWGLKVSPNDFPGYDIVVAPRSLDAMFEQLGRKT